MPAGTVQLLGVLTGAAHAVAWVLGSRWERPGHTARLRASLPRPSRAEPDSDGAPVRP